jgi:hypothetical protein
MPDVLMHTRDIKRHYAVERALADRLRKASRSERLKVTEHETPEATASETARSLESCVHS